MDSFAFLERSGRAELQPIYVLHGDEDFLKRQVLKALRVLAFGAGGDDFGLSTHAGDKAVFAAIHDELQTMPFLGGRRLVVVDNADPFVTRHRAALEKYVTQSSATGILVLDVRTWTATTKLAKLVNQAGTITCKAPAAYKLPEWCVGWAAAEYGKTLSRPAAALLVNLTGPEMGQLDQDLAKLAVYVGQATRIDADDVDKLVGSSRAESAFKVFDAVAGGKPGEALDILNGLLEQGNDPLFILGAFSLQLRRLAQAARLTQQGLSLAAALEQAGVQAWVRQGCEQQLRHIGRRRAERLFGWLLEVDLGIKGGSSLPPRYLLERLVVRLARKEK